MSIKSYNLLIFLCALTFQASSNELRWYSYQQKPAVCSESPQSHFENGRVSPPSCFVWLNTDDEGWIYSQGPWWIDPNHEMLVGGNGIGLVNVIAFSRYFYGGIIDLTNKVVTFETQNNIHMIEATSLFGLKKSHIYFWFQTSPRILDNCEPDPTKGENCTRQSDYILTANDEPLVQFETNEPYAKHRIFISSFSPDDWTCLGAGRNVKYDCMPITEALQDVSVFGFLAAPVNGCITDKPWQVGGVCDLDKTQAYQQYVFNTGVFRFKDFYITNKSDI